MTRLIDADALIEDVRKNSASYFADDFAHEWVDKQPTVDAVSVIHCKNCKHRKDNGRCYERNHIQVGLFVWSDDSCGWAERKEK